MTDIRTAYESLIARVLHGPGDTSPMQRRAAFDDQASETPVAGLLHKVAVAASTVSDTDIAAARGSGFSEDQLFELMVCAAVGAASRLHEAALTVLDAACKEER